MVQLANRNEGLEQDCVVNTKVGGWILPTFSNASKFSLNLMSVLKSDML